MEKTLIIVIAGLFFGIILSVLVIGSCMTLQKTSFGKADNRGHSWPPQKTGWIVLIVSWTLIALGSILTLSSIRSAEIIGIVSILFGLLILFTTLGVTFKVAMTVNEKKKELKASGSGG